MSNQIKLSVKDFRAIKEANIKLNGITVVSGVNGSGKSTLSKFLYYTFRLANDYESIALGQLRQSLSEVFHFISILEREIMPFRNDKTLSVESKRTRSLRTSITTLDKKDELVSSIRLLANSYIELQNNNAFKEENVSRLIYVLKNTLNDINIEENDFEILIENLYDDINRKFSNAESIINSRPAILLRNSLEGSFLETKLPNNYEISEYDVPIISNDSDFVPLIHSVQYISYIDTPMMIGVSVFSENDYWDNLNMDLTRKHNNSSVSHEKIRNIIHKDILKGECDYVEDLNSIQDDTFLFKQDDGSVFNLLECATGVKSFSILQLLLKNGFLTKNTLLIIDEPEAHLHPQWIVEYARMIVLLNKEIGVKFFIASHSPDMVSAIKYISEKEQTTQNLEYYLAEQTKENPYLFNYKSLETNIDPIFESFNIALDRINQYGISNEHNDLF